MKKRKFFEKGFTLVELLIVIALIAILSVAVLATINPIEQTNKARDAKFKNDAAEVLGALERFYASQNAYPWNVGIAPSAVAVSTTSKVAIGSTDVLFGVLDAGASGGVLISTSELKSSFMGKEPFADDAAPVDAMYIYHNGTDSSYVCFVPKASANRKTGGGPNPNLKCMAPGTGTNAYLLNIGQSAGGNTCASITDWTVDTAVQPAAVSANLLCVPEGDIQ